MRLARIATPDGPRPVVERDGRWLGVVDLFDSPLEPTGESYPLEGAELLAPVEPLVVLGMAHNSGPADRALPASAFMKSARTVVGPGDPIVLDADAGRLKGECELTIVVGRECRKVTAEEAEEYILGWTVGNDVTAPDGIASDEKMISSKSGDGFTPIGPWVETELDALDVALVATVNGREAASSSSAALAWNPFEVLAYASAHMTLGPGDIILTGAPGTGFDVVVGDECGCEVAGIGFLGNPVVALDA